MATRKPLVTKDGRSRELPAGDSIALFGDLATLDQFADADPNIAEVEATRALRVTLRPQGDNEADPVVCMGRYAMGFVFSHVAGTTFVANSEILSILNLSNNPIALRKLGISAATSALTGARVGLCRISLLQMNACVALSNPAFALNPPGQFVKNVGAPNAGLKTRQNIPLLTISNSQDVAQPNGLPGHVANTTTRSIGEATGGAPSAIGTNIPPTWLFDSYGTEPFWLMPTMGLYLNSTFPPAVTSQTIQYGVSMIWDEWQIRSPR